MPDDTPKRYLDNNGVWHEVAPVAARPSRMDASLSFTPEGPGGPIAAEDEAPDDEEDDLVEEDEPEPEDEDSEDPPEPEPVERDFDAEEAKEIKARLRELSGYKGRTQDKPEAPDDIEDWVPPVLPDDEDEDAVEEAFDEEDEHEAEPPVAYRTVAVFPVTPSHHRQTGELYYRVDYARIFQPELTVLLRAMGSADRSRIGIVTRLWKQYMKLTSDWYDHCDKTPERMRLVRQYAASLLLPLHYKLDIWRTPEGRHFNAVRDNGYQTSPQGKEAMRGRARKQRTNPVQRERKLSSQRSLRAQMTPEQKAQEAERKRKARAAKKFSL